jgi:stage II sporulation protein M
VVDVLFFPVRQVLRDNRSWLIMAAAIFFVCAVVFYYTSSTFPEQAGQVVDSQLEDMLAFFELFIEANPLISSLLIFMNNFLSMAQMLLLGVVAGISPLFTLGLNGAMVGVLLAITTGEGLPLFLVIAYGIMPHGIFELFAFFLCGAMGLKFGYHCVASPLPGKTRMESFRYIWKEVISVMPLIVTLLLAAAFVEMLVTPKLLESIMP